MRGGVANPGAHAALSPCPTAEAAVERSSGGRSRRARRRGQPRYPRHVESVLPPPRPPSSGRLEEGVPRCRMSRFVARGAGSPVGISGKAEVVRRMLLPRAASG